MKDRPALDDKENSADYYGLLADSFNDYTLFPYKNATANYSEACPLGDEPIPGMEAALDLCQDINPSLGLELRPPRDHP